MSSAKGKPKHTDREIGICLLILFVAGTLWYQAAFRSKPSKPDEEAFNACHSQLKVIAYPAHANIPRVDGRADGAHYYFSWPSGTGIFLGHRTDDASCFVLRETLEITSLTVNGKEQIWRRPD